MKDKQPAHTEPIQISSKKLELTKEIAQTETEPEPEQIKSEKKFSLFLIIKIIILWVLLILGLIGFLL